MQEVLKKVALICQTSRGSLWEKELWTQDPWAGRLCPPPSSTVTALTRLSTAESYRRGSFHQLPPQLHSTLMTPDGGVEMSLLPLQVGPPLRRILCCLLEAPSGTESQVPSVELLILARPLAGFSRPTSASWGRCYKVPPPHSLSLQKSSQRQSSSPDLR